MQTHTREEEYSPPTVIAAVSVNAKPAIERGQRCCRDTDVLSAAVIDVHRSSMCVVVVAVVVAAASVTAEPAIERANDAVATPMSSPCVVGTASVVAAAIDRATGGRRCHQGTVVCSTDILVGVRRRWCSNFQHLPVSNPPPHTKPPHSLHGWTASSEMQRWQPYNNEGEVR